MDSAPTKRPHFGEQNDGLRSVVDVASRPMYYSAFPITGSSLRYLSLSSSSSVSSPRSARYFHDQLPRQPHFLEACFLCRKPIGGNKDIYMYRGDTPFCTEECRQEQIEMDEAKEQEKKWNYSSSMKKALRKNQKKSNNSQAYPFRAGTVVAA